MGESKKKYQKKVRLTPRPNHAAILCVTKGIAMAETIQEKESEMGLQAKWIKPKTIKRLK